MQDRTIPLRSIDAGESVSDDRINLINQFDEVSTVQNNANVVSLFGGKTASSKSEVEVIFTTDRDLLQQYYELRHYAYRDENGWKDYNGLENDYDRQGKILVAVRNGKVIGGTRIMFSDECDRLSNEISGTELNYQSIIKKYDKREGIVCSEISAVVVAKGERDRSVSMKMFEANLEEAHKHGCNYICGVGVAVVCRDYRRIFRELGYYLEIVISRPWQEKETYNLAKMFPMHVRIS